MPLSSCGWKSAKAAHRREYPLWGKMFHALWTESNNVPASLSCDKGAIGRYTATGGKLIPASLSFSGDHAAELLEKYNVDVMIFSASGISDNGYIVDTSEEIANLRRRIFKSVRKKVFVCDKEKFSCPAPYNVAALKEMDYVICNAKLPENINFGGELITV